MKIAVVSDLHANLPAWQAVRLDIARQGVDGIVCLGDVVGYGPHPNEVLADLLDSCDNLVLGNHDAVIAGRLDPAVFNPTAREAIDWTRRRLDPSAAEFFANRPTRMGLDDVLCVHAEAAEPERWTYICGPEQALPSFLTSTARLILVGHTHLPGVFVFDEETGLVLPADPVDTALQPGRRYLVNVGSVGDPRDGDERASYAILDTAIQQIFFRRVPFDHDTFRRDLRATGLSHVPWFLRVLDQRVADASPLHDMSAVPVPRHAVDSPIVPLDLRPARPRRSATRRLAGITVLAALLAAAGYAWHRQSKPPATATTTPPTATATPPAATQAPPTSPPAPTSPAEAGPATASVPTPPAPAPAPSPPAGPVVPAPAAAAAHQRARSELAQVLRSAGLDPDLDRLTSTADELWLAPLPAWVRARSAAAIERIRHDLADSGAGPLPFEHELVLFEAALQQKFAPGLRVEVFAGPGFAPPPVHSQVAAAVNFPGNSPGPMFPGVTTTGYSCCWAGVLRVQQGGRFAFRFVTSGTGTLELAGQRVESPPRTPDPPPLETELRSGQAYPLTLRHAHADGPLTAVLEWKLPGDAVFSPVPPQVLFHRPPPPAPSR